MKIERKTKTTRRNKKQRKTSLSKRVTKKPNFKYQRVAEINDDIEQADKETIVDQNETESFNTSSRISDFIKKIKLSKAYSTKIILTTWIAITVIIVSFNINPIIQYAFQDQNSAIYPILKKYADDLRRISSRLTVVTRRLNMLSLISEENELTNTNRINSLVLQINEMWFTTKKYLNFIGIETIAHTDLEKEIEENSKINEKGLIRETKTEEIFPEDEITLTNVLKLDSVIQDLNIQIDNVNNEITFLEDNVYASIKASHIYSHLLERSRNANGNFYANSTVRSNNNSIPVTINTNQPVTTMTQNPILVTNNTPVKTKTITKIKTTAKKQEIVVAKVTPTIEPVKVKKLPKKVQQQPEPVATTKTPRKKIIGAFKIKEKTVTKSRNDQNKLSNKKKESTKIVKASKKEDLIPVETNSEYESPFLLDDVIMNFVTTYDDYGDAEDAEEEKTEVSGIEEDDYTGG